MLSAKKNETTQEGGFCFLFEYAGGIRTHPRRSRTKSGVCEANDGQSPSNPMLSAKKYRALPLCSALCFFMKELGFEPTLGEAEQNRVFAKPIIPVCQRQIGRGTDTEQSGVLVVGRSSSLLPSSMKRKI